MDADQLWAVLTHGGAQSWKWVALSPQYRPLRDVQPLPGCAHVSELLRSTVQPLSLCWVQLDPRYQ